MELYMAFDGITVAESHHPQRSGDAERRYLLPGRGAATVHPWQNHPEGEVAGGKYFLDHPDPHLEGSQGAEKRACGNCRYRADHV